MYLSTFLFLVITFWPRFYSDYLAFSVTGLSKWSTMHTDISLIKYDFSKLINSGNSIKIFTFMIFYGDDYKVVLFHIPT